LVASNRRIVALLPLEPNIIKDCATKILPFADSGQAFDLRMTVEEMAA
jgi:hypothetical protein